MQSIAGNASVTHVTAPARAEREHDAGEMPPDALPCATRQISLFAYREACAQKGMLRSVKVVKWYITNVF